ncbi:MATE family efflux transporter [Sphingomonas cavernae]|uniref:MATE family efflux transporter n=1 Tax=Sphingomonas cavernae TaxID=2320861 RepID=A0A418WPE8_9SPHN|nr:MATE family efflux transporter [Sphingomonas cavernae]RJF93090.1 MATE family efflux transporter [Sphingomonas cavernae]
MANASTRATGTQDLLSGSISRTLLLFALPTLGSNILQSLNGSVNAIWVGRFLGEDAIAATANANMIMFLMFAAVFGFGMAATILVGQSFGRRDIDGARRAMGSAIGMFLLLSIVIAILGWTFSPQILRLLATPGEAFALAEDYLRIIFVSMPSSFVMVLLMMGLRGSGDSMTPLWFMGLSVVLDIVLNPVLILGLGPAPAMGIAGSAAATAIAGYVSVIALIAYMYARDLPLRLRGHELGYLKPDPALLRPILLKGFPMGLQMIVISTASLAMVGLVNREGLIAAAAYGVTQQLWTYVQMPAMAIGAAVSAMAAQNIGAGRWDRVGKITASGLWYNVLMTGALALLLTLVDRPALALFLGSDSPAIPVAAHIHLLGGWSFVFFGATLVLFGTMRANGAVIAPLVILFVVMYPVRLGFIYLAYPAIGADALWLSFTLGSIVSAGLAILAYRSGGWRKTQMMAPPDPEECREAINAESEPAGRLTPTG